MRASCFLWPTGIERRELDVERLLSRYHSSISLGMARVPDAREERCSWGRMLVLFLVASLIKLLVLAPGMYHSTDFEVRG